MKKKGAILCGIGLMVLNAACQTGEPEVDGMGGSDAREGWESREISVSLQVPDPAWEVAIGEIHIVGGELWVLSELSRDRGRIEGRQEDLRRGRCAVRRRGLKNLTQPRRLFGS